MSNCTLKGFVSPEISLFNHMETGSKIQLQTKCSYNVKYSSNLNCRGELTAEVTDKNEPDKFKVKVVVIGIFSYKEGADKDLLHIDTFKILFPYARALISTITANSGIPAIILPEVNIEDQNIYRIGME